ncbi:MAG: hypothetical protein P4L40_22545 [Terracidiphilus sp.]|nr:hypothetical protein [Terracidiphilus sp.]
MTEYPANAAGFEGELEGVVDTEWDLELVADAGILLRLLVPVGDGLVVATAVPIKVTKTEGVAAGVVAGVTVTLALTGGDAAATVR